MILSSIFLLLQSANRGAVDRDIQNMLTVGRFIFGMVIARVISLVLVLILAFALMRSNRVRAVVTAHAITFLLFAGFLVVGWLGSGRSTVDSPAGARYAYRESADFPFGNLLISTASASRSGSWSIWGSQS